MGGNGFCSHSHNDLFSPVIYLNGQLILTDTGTSIYIGNDTERDYLRSASAHNTTFVATWKFFKPKRWFGWEKTADGRILRKEERSNEFAVECGYKRPRNIPYTRTVFYQPDFHRFRIRDAFSENLENVHSYFHLAEGLNAVASKNKIQIIKNGILIGAINFPEYLSLKIETGWISKTYGVKEASEVLHFTWNASISNPVDFVISEN